MRIRLFGLVAAIGLFGFFASPAQALFVGDLTGTEPDTLLVNGEADVHPTLSRVSGTTLIDLATQVTTDGAVDEYGGWLYFTNASGFWKQHIGTETKIRVRSGPNLRLVEMVDKWAIVSDYGSSSSILYSAQTGKIWKFSPKIKDISAASITLRGGKVKLAILGKNMAGKQKLFFSDQDPRHHVTEVSLPRYAKSCDNMQMSPSNDKIFLGCTFNIPGQGNNLKGYVLSELNRTELRSPKRIISNVSYYDIDWMNNSKLVTVEVDNDGIGEIVVRNFTKQRITSSHVFAGTESLTYNDRAAWLAPYDVEPYSSGGFYQMYAIQYVDGQAPYIGPTVLAAYFPPTDQNYVMSDDGNFRYYPN